MAILPGPYDSQTNIKGKKTQIYWGGRTYKKHFPRQTAVIIETITIIFILKLLIGESGE